MSATGVAELQSLVLAGLDLVARAQRLGHTRKAGLLVEQLAAAIRGDTPKPVPPALKAGQNRGVDWDSVLPQAAAAGRTMVELARDLNISPQSVWAAGKQRGIALPYSNAAKLGRPVAPVDWDRVLPIAAAAGRTVISLAAEFKLARASVRGACKRRGIVVQGGRLVAAPARVAPSPPIVAPSPPVVAAVMPTMPAIRTIPAMPAGTPGLAAPAPARAIMDSWKVSRIRTDLIAGRPLERIATMRCVPLEAVVAERDRFMGSRHG